ncbi:hypothetical protein KIN20_006433 [Parelaphostrongylus tenuis]|uniref:Uncharacterized protein n=1 Tax=Parelaphostrongylus tenuis TaxID=148309 RepID=A0AAD5QJC6_PARTN|nr:hypothetical protein KIN20_006433 [Parelaphostrongylus tenuis]
MGGNQSNANSARKCIVFVRNNEPTAVLDRSVLLILELTAGEGSVARFSLPIMEIIVQLEAAHELLIGTHKVAHLAKENVKVILKLTFFIGSVKDDLFHERLYHSL